jgi:hypothetical protein
VQEYQEIREKIRQSGRHQARSRGLFSKNARPCYRAMFSSTLFVFFLLELLAVKINTAGAVPDLEPTLQDSKYFEPEKLKLHFRPSRKYTASTHYIHIRVPFNFTDPLETPDRIYAHYDKHIRIWPKLFKTQMKQVVEVSQACLSDKINDFVDILDALPHHTTVT